jgi:hypothetical protein
VKLPQRKLEILDHEHLGFSLRCGQRGFWIQKVPNPYAVPMGEMHTREWDKIGH